MKRGSLRMMSRTKIRLGMAAILGTVVVLALLAAWDGEAEPPLPNPNGYTVLCEAAQLVRSRLLKDVDGLDRMELENRVRENQPALDWARRGLALPVHVPLPVNIAALPARNDELSALRGLALGFLLESRWREVQGDFAGAAQACLDVVKLGTGLAARRLISEYTTGTEIVMDGASRLARLAERFDGTTCRKVASSVKEATRGLPSFDEVQAANSRFYFRHGTLKTKLLHPLNRLTTQRKWRAMMRPLEHKRMATLWRDLATLEERASAASQSPGQQ